MSASDLYFMLNPGLGIIKIGIAGDVQQRRATLECACGVPLEVLAVVPGGERLEKPLHEAFMPSRLIGEWFAPTDELLALIDDPTGIDAFLKRMAPQVAEWQRTAAAEEEARRAEEAVHRQAEKAKLAAIAAEKKRVEKERADRVEAKRREREKAKRLEVEKQQREWARRHPTAVLHVQRPDVIALAAERRQAIIGTQRGKNAAMLGTVPIEKLNRNETERPRREGEAGGGNH